MVNSKNNERFLELDALRGIAALMVIFYHFTMGREEARFGLGYGFTGVDLFFLISGFVIFKSTINTTSTDFLIKRFSRLYPTYWAAITLTFILIILYPKLETGNWSTIDFYQYGINLTMFQYYFRVPNIDGPYWTLIVEMNFYIFVFLSIKFRFLKWLTYVLLTLLLLTVFLLYFKIDTNWVNRMYFLLPIALFLPFFIAGIAFYKIYSTKQHLVFNYTLIIVCLLIRLYFLKLSYTYHDPSKTVGFYEHSAMDVLFFGIFFLLMKDKMGFIVNRYTLFLGKISYALYLIHQYVSITYILPYTTEKLHINFWIASLFITLPIVILLATLITFYVEIPANKKIKQLVEYVKSKRIKV